MAPASPIVGRAGSGRDGARSVPDAVAQEKGAGPASWPGPQALAQALALACGDGGSLKAVSRPTPQWRLRFELQPRVVKWYSGD